MFENQKKKKKKIEKTQITKLLFRFLITSYPTFTEPFVLSIIRRKIESAIIVTFHGRWSPKKENNRTMKTKVINRRVGMPRGDWSYEHDKANSWVFDEKLE